MCNKVDVRIECFKCGYPYSEAQYPDTDPPKPCDTPVAELVEDIIAPFEEKSGAI